MCSGCLARAASGHAAAPVCIPTVLTIVLGIVLAVGGVNLGHHLGPVDKAEANQAVAGSRGIAELPTLTGALRAFTCCFPI